MALGHVPVANGKIGDAELGVAPLLQTAVVELEQAAGVGVDSLFLKVADEAVADLGRNEVRNEHGVIEDALGTEHDESHEPAGLVHLEEGQEMHSLVVRLLEKRLDPALVGLETANGLEMAQATSNHAGHTSNGLEEDEADELLLLARNEVRETRMDLPIGAQSGACWQPKQPWGSWSRPVAQASYR